MDMNLIPIMFVLSVAVAVSLVLAVYALQKSAPWAKPFVLLALATAEWSLAYLLELVHPLFGQKWFWFQVKYLGVSVISLLLFIFVLYYTGRFSWLKPAAWLLLLIRPAAAMLLTWVPSLNHLLATGLSISNAGAFQVLMFDPGIGYRVFGYYDFLLALFSTFLLCLKYVRSSSLARTQLSFLLIGILLPWLGSLISTWIIPSLPDIEMVPIFLAISLPILALGSFHYRLFDLLPIAHEIVLASMDDGMIILDQQNRIMEVNLAGQKILNKKPEEFLGLTAEEVLAYWPSLKSVVEDSAVSTAEISFEFGHEHRFYEVRKSTLQANCKEPGGCLITLRDITGRARLEEALRRSEAKYRSVVERGNDGIAILQGGIICYCNPQLARMVGKTPLQLSGLPLANIIVPGTKDDVVEHLAHQMYELYEPTRYEISLCHNNGTPIEVELSISLIEFEDQPALLAFVRDVSRRNRNLQLARENEERYKRISDLISDFAYACRIQPDGQLVSIWATGAFTRITGFSLESMDPYSALMTHIAAEDSYTAFHHTSRLFEGKPDVAEYRIVNKEGEIRWIRDYVRPVWDVEENRVTWFYGASQDITDRKQMEENLREAKETAEAATLAKSQFLANMSHEIRTPLNAIIGMTSLLLDARMDDEQREFVETIRTSGDALLTLINEILDFSKIEADRLDLENHPLNLRQCLEDALDIVAPHAVGKPIDLIYEIDPLIPEAVIGDAARLRQVLVNLISNAIKFTDQGEVVIHIRCAGSYAQEEDTFGALSSSDPTEKQIGDDGRPCEVRISVRDTGIGIPEDRIQRLFQSFSQIDSSTTRKYGGTGLGLAITRRLVELMGGNVTLESEPGVGSTFHVTIPFVIDQTPLPIYSSPDLGWLEGMRILVVDDNETGRRVFSQQLQTWGVIVDSASSSSEALDKIEKSGNYQLAFVDSLMPQMDGLTLANEIQQRFPEANLPVVILSPIGQYLHPICCSGLTACLTRPAKVSQLTELLQKLLKPGGFESVSPGSTLSEPVGPQFAAAHPLRILVAEDNTVNQKVALRMLLRLGYWADVAANGFEVLAALERQPYDLVLMDIQMPEMDGFEAAQKIQNRWGNNRPFRIIAATAYVFQADLDRCLAAGMDGFITKPIRMESLMDVLSRASDSGAVSKSSSVPENAAGGDLVNTARMEDLSASLGEGLLDVIESFLEDTPLLIMDLKAAYEREEMAEVERIAHSLKSSSGIFGAKELMDLCRRVELAAHDSTMKNSKPLGDIARAFEEVKAVLNLYKADSKPNGPL